MKTIVATPQKDFFQNLLGDASKMVYVKAVSNGIMDGKSSQLLECLRQEQAINQAIADDDPLDVDSSLRMLPILNEQKNVTLIGDVLEQVIIKAQNQSKGNFIHSSAAIRDICMFAASLISYGIEPDERVSGFSQTLMDLSITAKIESSQRFVHRLHFSQPARWKRTTFHQPT